MIMISANNNVGIQSQLSGCVCIKFYDRFDYGVSFIIL